ncbi:MAG: ABC transporter ATP-binding protein [Stappiaceae bacterium]
MSGQTPLALQISAITKRFGSLTANDGISLDLHEGQILALLGENGAGKTTLMSVLFGHYVADEGSIKVKDTLLEAGSPAASLEAGIGMVHQHFTLAENLSVLDNIMLGTERLTAVRRDTSKAKRKIAKLAGAFGLAVDPNASVGSLTVGERQRVEILKALYRDVRILILDEPTAVLTPQEADNLFDTLRKMTAEGLSIIFISHKLHEVLAIADEIAVLRHGKKVAAFPIEEASREKIAEAMVGEPVDPPVRQPGEPGATVLRLNNVDAGGTVDRPTLKSASFTLSGGEIVGLAGVSGNGQSVLADLVSGLINPHSGEMSLLDNPANALTPATAVRAGVGRIPEDRHATGVIDEMSIRENLALESIRRPPASRAGWVNWKTINERARTLMSRYDVRGGEIGTTVRRLSGGNMQKLILARVLEASPHVILANQPTRGLDIGATAYVHQQLFNARARGAGVLVISEDLDELMTLSDRIVVMFHGLLSLPISPENVTQQEIGLMMSGQSGFGEAVDAA